MDDFTSQVSNLRSMGEFVATYPGAADLLLLMDNALLKRKAITPAEIPENTPPYGDRASNLRLIAMLRAMSLIETHDDGFRLTNPASHVTSALRVFLLRDPQTIPVDAYALEVMRLLNRRGLLPPDPSSAPYTNRTSIRLAIESLALYLVSDDAISWLSRARTEFGGKTPLELIACGEIDRVLAYIKTADYALYF